MDITFILYIIIAIIFGAITIVVIPWIKTKTSVEQLDTIERWVSMAVTAAEQLYKKEDGYSGSDKKYYCATLVKGILESKGITYDDKFIDSLIESYVWELKNSMAE